MPRLRTKPSHPEKPGLKYLMISKKSTKKKWLKRTEKLLCSKNVFLKLSVRGMLHLIKLGTNNRKYIGSGQSLRRKRERIRNLQHR